MMKTFKYILSTFLVISIIWSCTDDELNNLDFLDAVVAPANVAALFTIAQDNTGLVSILPSADGAVQFEIEYGDGTGSPAIVKAGGTIDHTYAEGNYTVNIKAKGVTGLTTDFSKDLLVSFQAPVFGTEPIIENDAAISKQVNVTVADDAQFAMYFDVYFVEDGIETIVTGNVGETVSYTYANTGLVDIKVVLKGGAIATVEYILEDFEVTAILQPLTSAPTPLSRGEADYISIYSDAYNNVPDSNYNPDWGQSGQGSSYAEFDLDGDKMLNYIKLSYQGIDIGSAINASSMEMLHIDVWTADDMSIDIYPLPDGVVADDERFVTKTLVANEWNSFDIPLSEFTDQGLPLDNLKQFKFTGAPWAEGTVFIDNLYFYKAPSAESVLTGTWKLAPEAGALKVGPSAGNGDWWTSDEQVVIDRACFFDDTYVFGSDGSFSNVLDGDTWLETWQGVASEECGTPVAPHNGGSATFTHIGNSLTINGTGAYLGLPKANNAGELPNVAVPTSITYEITLSDNDNTMVVIIEAGAGVFWTYKLVRDGAGVPSPIAGTWKLASEAGALKVGPSPDDLSWWSIGAEDVAGRACFFDDTYVFNLDGSFQNILGSDTWLEPWQGVDPEACGAPIAPHNGSNPATWSSTSTSVTVSGLGAYLGLPKVHNSGEDGAPLNNTITYDYVLSEGDNVMELTVVGYGGTGGTETWYFKLVREGSNTGGGNTGGGGTGTGTAPYSPIDFEAGGNGADWTWTVFENDSNPAVEIVANPNTTGNTSSTVAKITALQAGQPWVGCETTHGEGIGSFTFDDTNKIVRIWVYKSVVSDVGLKFAEANGEAQAEVKVSNTKINEWEELTFDMSGSIGKGITGIIDQIIIFPDFDTAGRTSDNVVYFDNITFGSN